MATLAEKKAAKAAAERKEKQKKLLVVPAAIAAALILALAVRFAPRATAALGAISNPAPRTDVEFFELLDNSGSIIAMDPQAKLGIANEADSIAGKISQLLGTVRVKVLRFGHTVVELPDAPYDSDGLLKTLKSDYIDANCDPEGGTFLAQALTRVEERSTPGSTLMIAVASTSWDDSTEARAKLAELKKSRKVILLVHGAAVHNVKVNKTQTDVRGQMASDIQVLGADGKVVGPTDFQDAVERWIPERLKANRIKLAGE
jgi:hypothetical protein